MMQSHLLVGPIPIAIDFSSVFSSSIIPGISSLLSSSHDSPLYAPRHSKSRRRRCDPVVVTATSSSSSWESINGEQDHYAVLGIKRNATSAAVKKAYRLLARKHHPDVSKHSKSGELFKSVRRAYEVLSNDGTRTEYDQTLKFQEDTGRSYYREGYYSPEVEDVIKMYRWSKVRQKMQHERYWEHYNNEEEETTEEFVEEGGMDEERGFFLEVLRSAFISLFLLQTFGAWLSLTFSSVMALFDRKLDVGYKFGFLVAWILGGRGGILLTMCLQFASWVCGKTSSSFVAVVVVAMWIGSNVARYAPLPQGALLTLLYMSIKLQVELKQ